MILAPGSTPWLLRHELRLAWRGLTARRGRGSGRGRSIWLLIGLPLVVMLAGGLPIAFAVRGHEVPQVPIAFAIAAVVVIMAFTLMLSQTLAAAVDALYDRADLDLLFSSPLKPRRVLTVRFLAVAFTVYVLYGLITTPLLLPAVVMGHPGWIAAEVVLFSVALGAAGAGLLVAFGLFHALGPRRTRTVGQVLAAVTGAIAFIIGQSYNILGRGRSAGLWATLVKYTTDPRFHPPPGWSWPLRAMTGEPLPLLAIAGTGVGLFLLANQLLGARFATDAAAAAGVGAGGAVRPAAGRVRARFSGGAFPATVRKELRLLARDPALISQVLLRVLYLLPLGFVLLRNAGTGQKLLLPGGVAAIGLFAGQIAASLAWITVSAEDAPDLLAAAPAPASVVRQGKVAAAVGPVAVIVIPILLAMAFFAPWVALVGAAGCAAQMAMGALLNIWWQRPGKRSEFRRRRQASWFVSLAEILLGIMIAAATAIFAFGSAWGLVPAILALVGMLLLSRSDAQIAEQLRSAA